MVAANRDEFFSRPSAPPQLLAESPKVLGGKDLLAGGTWLGINEYGMVAGILNRRSETKEEEPTMRSRGLLCLDLLRVRNPLAAGEFLSKEKGTAYRPFNLLFANEEEAYIAYNAAEEISCIRLGQGLHVFGNRAIYEVNSQKTDRAHLLFSQLQEGFQKNRGDLREWIPDLKAVLSDHAPAANPNNPRDSICVHTPSYGTVSSTLIFYSRAEKRFYNFHASGSPCSADYDEPLWLGVQ